MVAKTSKGSTSKYDFQQVLSLKTKKFSMPLDADGIDLQSLRDIEIDIENYEYQLLRAILGGLRKAIEIGKSDKIRSRIAFKFDGDLYQVADTKYGIRSQTTSSISSDAVTVEIKKVCKYLEKPLVDIKKSALKSNQIKLIYENQYAQYKQVFEYFDQQARKPIRRRSARPDSKQNIFAVPEVASFINRQARLQERHYASLMAVVTFYAYLEQAIGLLYPLSSAMKSIDINTFAIKDLFEKWDILIPADPVNLEHKAKLKSIYSNYRNLYVHGGVPKNINDLDAVVFGLYIPSKSPKMNFLPGYFHQNAQKGVDIYIKEISKNFNDFINHIEKDDSRIGIMYIKEGLPIVLDKKSNDTFQRMRKSKKTYVEWVMAQCEALDRHINAEM